MYDREALGNFKIMGVLAQYLLLGVRLDLDINEDGLKIKTTTKTTTTATTTTTTTFLGVDSIELNPITHRVSDQRLLMGGRGHSGPKSRCTVPQLNKYLKKDKSMSKILIKL